MIVIAFWVAVGAWLLWLLAMLLVGLGFDSWGEKFIPLAYLSLFVAITSSVVFIGWFGLGALGIDISIHHGR